MANTEVERRTDVDVEDVPSAEWGWSKENYRLIHIGGLLAAGFLLLMLKGNTEQCLGSVDCGCGNRRR